MSGRTGTGSASEGAEALSKRGAVEANRLSSLGGISTVGPYWGGEASAPRSYKPPLATPTAQPNPKGGVSGDSPTDTPQGAPVPQGCIPTRILAITMWLCVPMCTHTATLLQALSAKRAASAQRWSWSTRLPATPTYAAG